MKPGEEEAHTVAEVIDYLRELPEGQIVRTTLIEDRTFTVLVDRSGNARTVRNRDDHRWFWIELPVRQ